jgi:hypothetical protein
MDSLETLTVVLGWSTVINLVMLAFTAIMVMAMREWMVRMHARMFGVSEVDLPRMYFQYMAQYQIAIFVLNLAPYIALKVIA